MYLQARDQRHQQGWPAQIPHQPCSRHQDDDRKAHFDQFPHEERQERRLSLDGPAAQPPRHQRMGQHHRSRTPDRGAHLLRELKGLWDGGAVWAEEMHGFFLDLYKMPRPIADFTPYRLQYHEILKKADQVNGEVNAGLLQEAAEQALHQAMSTLTPKAQQQWQQGDYTASLQTLAALREPVDAFFEDVMVNAEQPELRHNRLVLLQQLHQAMNRVADLSRLAA